MVGKSLADSMNKGRQLSINFDLLSISNSDILSANHLSDQVGDSVCECCTVFEL